MSSKSEYADYVIEQFEVLGDVSARRMFGGYGIYRDGVMFALIADDALYLKVDDSNHTQFEARGCKPFTYMKAKGRPAVMSYYEVPDDVLEDPGALAEWARSSCAIARKKKAKS